MLGVGVALIVAIGLGTPMGIAAGFLGGWIDGVVGWLADLSLAFPALIIIIIAAAWLNSSTVATMVTLLATMVTLGLVLAPGVARIVRSGVLPLREELDVLAARVSGLTRLHIMGRELLPRIAGLLIVQASTIAGIALLTQAGVGVSVRRASLRLRTVGKCDQSADLGGMIADGVGVLFQDPWLIWPAGLLLALTAIVFALFGDAMRDVVTDSWSVRPRRAATCAIQPPAPPRACAATLARCWAGHAHRQRRPAADRGPQRWLCHA